MSVVGKHGSFCFSGGGKRRSFCFGACRKRLKAISSRLTSSIRLSATDHISLAEYNTEKVDYVQSWAEGVLDPMPDPEQAAAIGAVEGNVQIVARAGSGKTATLVNRAMFLATALRRSP